MVLPATLHGEGIIDPRRYTVLIHQHGEIVVEGDFDAEEVEAVIARTVPSTGLKPQRIIMLAILNEGYYSIAGWHLVIRRAYRGEA